MDALYRRKNVLSWAFYDWANSAFATTVMAGFFPAFFQKYWSVGVDPTVSTSRLGFANGVAGFVVALLAPILGTIADRSSRRKRFLMIWTLVGVLCTAALYFIQRGDWLGAFWLFVGGTVGFSAACVFYDALLLDVAAPAELDRVSAYGYALGYLGGGLLFAFNVLLTLKPQWFGLTDLSEAIRVSFVSVAVWWALFTLPLALNVRERGGGLAQSIVPAVRGGLVELAATLRAVSRYRELMIFLLAYWLYIDAVNTIIKMAVDYGMALGLPTASLLGALLLTQFVAFPASIFFGSLAARIGTKRSILIGIAVYIAATVYAFFLKSALEFFALAAVIGAVQGGVQSLSRSFFGRLVPPDKGGEFFGFYNMVGKFAAIVGPVLVGVVALTTASSRLAIVSLVVLFLAGALLLAIVQAPAQPVSAEHREAKGDQ